MNVIWLHVGQIVRLRKREAPYGILEGEEAVYVAHLTELPSADVYLNSSSEDQHSVVKTPQLVFTPTNWNELQEIVIFARDDDVIEDTPFYTRIHFNSFSSDVRLNRDVTVPIPIIDVDEGER